MKNSPIFRDRTEVTVDDLENFVANINKSDDDIVSDAIQRGARYVGFAVTEASSLSVNVAAGRLYFKGPRFYEEATEGTPLDLVGSKPGLQKRIVSIVAYPDEKDDDLEERDFETDAETGTKVPQQIKVVRYRHARLEAVPGAEAVSPQPPVINPSSAVVIATVLMGTAGIEVITQNLATQLDNLGDVADEVDDLKQWREDTEPKIATFTTELARLSARLDEIGNQDLAYSLALNVAEINERLDQPSAYNNYWSDYFVNASRSDKTAVGYKAKTEEGLRFAAIAEDQKQLKILNQYDPNVTISGDGLLLPKYNEIAVRVVKGGVGELDLAQYAFGARTSIVKSMTYARVRYGKEFEVSTNSLFYLSGQYSGNLNGVVSVFAASGKVFQQYETGRVDPDGYKIVRLSNYWADSVSTAYWSRVGDTQTITGYAWIETFLQTRGAWAVRIAPRVYRKPADGQLYVGLCETKEGAPDLSKMLVNVAKDATFWTPLGGLGSNAAPIPPTFLDGGARLGLVLQTAADYSVQQVETGATEGLTGTLHYGLNGGVYFADPSRHIMFDVFYATFPRTTVEVDLEPLSLSGGIATIDITAQTIVPEGCSLTYLVQIGSVWKPLEEAAASLLADLPNLVPLRIRLTGTNDVMPGINLAGSVVRVARPATVLKHVSETKLLNAPSSTIKLKTRLRNFDPAHHTQSAKILVGTGYATIETADAVVDVARPYGIERTYTFNLAAAVTSCKVQIDETTDSPSNLFVTDLATGVALT